MHARCPYCHAKLRVTGRLTEAITFVCTACDARHGMPLPNVDDPEVIAQAIIDMLYSSPSGSGQGAATSFDLRTNPDAGL